MRWPHVRAALIAGACMIGLIDGCPIGSPKDMQGEWGADLVESIRPVQRAVLTPFAPLGRLFKVKQRWALMQAARPDRVRFLVEGQTSPTSPWSVLYRAGDPDHTAFSSLLDHTRVSGVYNPGREVTSQYRRFVDWFLSYVLEHMPELTAVRVSYERVHLDAGTLTPTGATFMPIVRRRGDK